MIPAWLLALVLTLLFPVRHATVDRIIFCESRYEADAQNPVSSAAGLFQITAGTWRDVRKRQPHLPPFEVGRYDPWVNLEAGYWLIQHRGLQPWFSSRSCWS